MSRKKQNSKVELLQELRDQLETLRENASIDAATVGFSSVEESDFVAMIEKPFDGLLINLDTFLANVENEVYEEEDNFGVEEEY